MIMIEQHLFSRKRRLQVTGFTRLFQVLHARRRSFSGMHQSRKHPLSINNIFLTTLYELRGRVKPTIKHASIRACFLSFDHFPS